MLARFFLLPRATSLGWSVAKHSPSFFVLIYISVYLFMPYRLLGMPVSNHTAVLLLPVFCLLVYPGLLRRALHAPDVQVFSVLVLLCGISVFVNADHTYWFGVASYCLSFLAFIVVRSLFSAKHLPVLNVILSVFLFLSGVISILQVLYGNEFYVVNLFAPEVYNPPYAVGLGLSSPNIMGLFMLWALGLQACYLGIHSGRHHAGWFPWSALILGICGIYFTLSRSVWLGLGFFLLAFLFSLWMNGRSLRVFGCILMVVILTFLVCFLLPTRSDNLEMRKITEGYSTGGTIQIRSYLWRLAAIRIWKQSLLGSGVGNFEVYFDKDYAELDEHARELLNYRPNVGPNSPLFGPHNSIAEFAHDFGILPATAAMLLILLIIFSGLRYPINDPAHMFSLALLGVIIGMQFNDLSKERLLWIGLALIAALASQSSFRQVEQHLEVPAIRGGTIH